jgi:hypothetical protein
LFPLKIEDWTIKTGLEVELNDPKLQNIFIDKTYTFDTAEFTFQEGILGAVP